MSTLKYQGDSQPALASEGWLDRLGNLFGTATPTYAGTGQPAPAPAGLLTPVAPVYLESPPSSCPVPDAVEVPSEGVHTYPAACPPYVPGPIVFVPCES